MALTLKTQLRLESVSLVQLFEQNRAIWLKTAKDTYDFIRKGYPKGFKIRPDDVSVALRPIIEVNEIFMKKRIVAKLRQQYYVHDFADLVTERVWIEITGGKDGQQPRDQNKRG